MHQRSMNLQFVDFRSTEHKDSLDMVIKFIIESKSKSILNVDEQLVLSQTTNHIRLILMKITTYDD